MKSIFKALGILALFGLSAQVNAGLITDTVVQDVKVGWWDSYSFSHDLTEPGDDVFTLGSATSASLKINITDDSNSRRDLWEIILFTVEDFDFDTGRIQFSATNFVNDLEVEALGALNSDGFLDITITSLFGDFYVGNSTLTVVTAENASVPEPSLIALFGAGLIGLGFARRMANK